ncbi:MAG TPA: alcohol dehydrogenase [Massilia sp.]|nr:alcohol dehydrogenase [Massilia sp.]
MRHHVLVYRSFGLPVEQLSLESLGLSERPPGCLRVAMSLAPINPSDLIPITGAYAHRISLPGIAGYEGVGTVIEAPSTHAGLLGRRVLPLRGPGTWQSYVDCDPELAIPVPDAIPDGLAARAYINPLAAATMLARWPVQGKRVLLSGAGSACAELLASWAVQHGAATVAGIYRSGNRARRLRALGVEPVCQDDSPAIAQAARAADITFDALGGSIGSAVLGAMGTGAVFVGYGLLSGQGIRHSGQVRAQYCRFHLRDALAGMTAGEWQQRFVDLWPALQALDLPAPRMFRLADWRSAIGAAAVPGAPKSILCLR